MVEGIKSVTEFINSGYRVETIYHTLSTGAKLLNLSRNINILETAAKDLEKISSLTTAPDVIALVKIPADAKVETAKLRQSFSLVLDGIQDPGNLGTIIRTADWFGIKNIICSEDTVDAYNPKVVQATMGSLAHVNVWYVDLPDFIKQCNIPVFGALLAGDNIYATDFGTEGLIVLGNEGNGLRPEIQQLITKKITIPQAGRAESLNVAIAAAVFCSEVCRKTLK